MVLAAQQRLGAPVSGHCTTRNSSSPASWSTDDPLNFTLSLCVGTLRELICIVQNLCNVEIYNCAGCRQRASGRCSPLSSLTRAPKSSHSVSKQQQRTTCNFIGIALHTFCSKSTIWNFLLTCFCTILDIEIWGHNLEEANFPIIIRKCLWCLWCAKIVKTLELNWQLKLDFVQKKARFPPIWHFWVVPLVSCSWCCYDRYW